MLLRPFHFSLVRAFGDLFKIIDIIVGGDPDPEDPHVFGLPGFNCQRYGSGSFPFLS
jgi:hypothetical protein